MESVNVGKMRVKWNKIRFSVDYFRQSDVDFSVWTIHGYIKFTGDIIE